MPAGSVVSLRGREHDADVIHLLVLAQIHREAADAARRGPLIALDYANAEHLVLYGYEEEDGRVVGVVGVEPAIGKAIIRDLAVTPEARRRGIGRALIDYLRGDLGFAALEGDTLAQAVAFYERCGFLALEDGVMSDGRTRYRFRWTPEELG